MRLSAQAKRDAIARERIGDSVRSIAKNLAVPRRLIPAMRPQHRDAGVRAMLFHEEMAAFLDLVVDGLERRK